MRSMTSSRTPVRRAAATWAAHTYAASRSRTAVRMATERSFGSTTLSSRKKVTRPSTRSASFGLWSSMLNGPRTPPKTFSTFSRTTWCSAGTSDLPVTGAMRGMRGSFLEGGGGVCYSLDHGRLHHAQGPRRNSRARPDPVRGGPFLHPDARVARRGRYQDRGAGRRARPHRALRQARRGRLVLPAAELEQE